MLTIVHLVLTIVQVEYKDNEKRIPGGLNGIWTELIGINKNILHFIPMIQLAIVPTYLSTSEPVLHFIGVLMSAKADLYDKFPRHDDFRKWIQSLHY